jgi:hypothetical protein
MASEGSAAANPPAAEKETQDIELKALKDAADAIGRRLDALLAARGDEARADKDDKEEERDDAFPPPKEEEEGEDDKPAFLKGDKKDDTKADEGDRAKKVKNDDTAPRADAKKADDDDKPFEEWAEEEKEEPNHEAEKPTPLAADRKKDEARADAAMRRYDDSALRRRLDALERERTDEEIEALSAAQQAWNEVAMAHGERGMRPLFGESSVTFDRRNAKHFQDHSEMWKGKDLSKLPASVLRDIAAPQIRKDALDAAYRGVPGAEPMLREVYETDGVGRRITKFVGPITAFLDQFRPPAMAVKRFNRNPDAI